MKPTVQEYMADAMDREATVVRVEGMSMLEVEDKVEQGQRGLSRR